MLPIGAWQEKRISGKCKCCFLRPLQRLSWDISSKTNRVFGHVATDWITDFVCTESACLDSQLSVRDGACLCVFWKQWHVQCYSKFTNLFFFCQPFPPFLFHFRFFFILSPFDMIPSPLSIHPSIYLSSSVCNEDYPCEGMSRHATFENFGMAFLTLFQVSTGDNWNGIMKVRSYLLIICVLTGIIRAWEYSETESIKSLHRPTQGKYTKQQGQYRYRHQH